MSAKLQPFHLAIPVDDLDTATSFYCDLLGCVTGRTASRWVDLNFFGHQVTLHLVDDAGSLDNSNEVDGDNVPTRHFGIVLGTLDWQALASRLEAANANFLISPRVRFKGETGEQSTMFIRDPAGNAIEFKSFADPSRLFAR